MDKASADGGGFTFPKVDKFPCRDLNQLYPVVKAKALALIDECKKQGIDIIITQTYRSTEYQDSLYAQGRTAPGKIVTNCKGGTSPHNFRVAFDVCINSKDPYNVALLKKVGAIGKGLKLTWGGNFKSIVDLPHFQYNGTFTDAQIRAGKVPV